MPSLKYNDVVRDRAENATYGSEEKMKAAKELLESCKVHKDVIKRRQEQFDRAEKEYQAKVKVLKDIDAKIRDGHQYTAGDVVKMKLGGKV